jgi:hypothetical protein
MGISGPDPSRNPKRGSLRDGDTAGRFEGTLRPDATVDISGDLLDPQANLKHSARLAADEAFDKQHTGNLDYEAQARAYEAQGGSAKFRGGKGADSVKRPSQAARTSGQSSNADDWDSDDTNTDR